MKKCGKCLKENPDQAERCLFCGNPLELSSTPPETEVEAPAEEGIGRFVGRYVLAILACAAIEVVHIALCILFGWKRCGGYLVVALVMAAMATAWNKITKQR